MTDLIQADFDSLLAFLGFLGDSPSKVDALKLPSFRVAVSFDLRDDFGLQ
jgi:hypothetical protein